MSPSPFPVIVTVELSPGPLSLASDGPLAAAVAGNTSAAAASAVSTSLFMQSLHPARGVGSGYAPAEAKECVVQGACLQPVFRIVLIDNVFVFLRLESGQLPQEIVKFSQQTDLPLQMGLLIDTSGSVHGRFQFEQDAANGFLQHTIRPHYDHAFVMGFNGHNKVIQDFTDSTSLLAAGVQRLEAGGGTALFQAIYTACKEKLLKDDSDRPTRRALIVPLGTSQ